MNIFMIVLGCFWFQRETVSTDTTNEIDTLQIPEESPVAENTQIELSGPITCENPSRRDEEPMYLADLGNDWSSQPVEGYSPPPGFIFGGEGVSVGDFNQDRLLDIFVPTLDKNLFFIQQSDGTFVERSDELLPVDNPTYTVGSSAVDFDGDQDLDLFVLNLIEPNQLLENQGNGSFKDVSIEKGIVQSSYYYPGATWGDSDQDGDLDLLVLTTGIGPIGPPPWNSSGNFEEAGPNRLYKNEPGESFQLVSLPNHTPEPYSCCAAFVDVNLDNKNDLYIVNDFGMYVQPNQLFLGGTNGDFSESFNTGIDIGMYGMGLAVGAINNDDYPDFVVSDWGRLWLLTSDGEGTWYDNTLNSNLIANRENQHIAWGVELHDVDNDADLDIWVGYGHLDIPEAEQQSFDEVELYNPRYQPDALFLQNNGTYEDVAEQWGLDRSTISRGGIWADLNNDGFLDFISPAIDGPVLAYLANCNDSSWTRVKLHQPSTKNTDAVGARVKVTTGNHIQTRWILAGTSLSSSGPLEAHFGLGTADMIDELQVIWPDGSTSIFYDIESNQIIDITKE